MVLKAWEIDCNVEWFLDEESKWFHRQLIVRRLVEEIEFEWDSLNRSHEVQFRRWYDAPKRSDEEEFSRNVDDDPYSWLPRVELLLEKIRRTMRRMNGIPCLIQWDNHWRRSTSRGGQNGKNRQWIREENSGYWRRLPCKSLADISEKCHRIVSQVFMRCSNALPTSLRYWR